MAWNRPTSNTVDATSSSRSSGRGKIPRLRRGLIAGVIVVLGAGIAAWLLTSGGATSSSLQKKDRGLIKEVAPAKAKTNKVEAATVAVTNEVPNVIPRHFNPHAKRQFGVGNIVDTNDIRRTKSKYDIFPNHAENYLAFLANVPLGTTVVGGLYFTPAFRKDLEAALIDKIVIEDADSEEVRQMKQSVIEVQHELRKRLKAGEDIVQILKDTHSDIQRLGVVRQDIERQIREASADEDLTNEDLGKVIEKANEMLGEKGLAPIEYDSLTRTILTGRAKRKPLKKESQDE